MHRVSDSRADGQGTDVTPTPRELLVDTDQVVLADRHDLDRVGKLVVRGTGVDVGRQELLGRFRSDICARA